MSVKRSATSIGLATALGHASQFLWLIAAIRVMPADDFGAVLAAQALYAALQVVVDVGPNAIGTRLAARGDLDAPRRGEVLRMRVILALAVVPVALVLGVLNVSGSLSATLPFVLALVLFALLNVWEPYGRGNARPLATYTFARSAVLAGTAVAFLLAGARFPVPLAGLLECVAIVLVMVLFGRAPLASLRLAARARGGPWPSVFWIAGPSFTAQSSLAAGTLVLSGSGSPASAGIFAACVRLLTGINAVNSVVALSLYPRLARDAAAESNGDRRLVTIALTFIALLAAGATAICALLGGPISEAFLRNSSSATISALVLTLAASLPLGNIVMFSFQMLASGLERAMMLPFATGALATVGLAIVAVAAAGPRPELVAASLLTGQLVTMAGLGARLCGGCSHLRPAVVRSMVNALLLAVLACAALLPGGAIPAGLILLALSLAMTFELRRMR